MAALVDHFREFFLLRDAERRAAAIAPETRESASHELERARQKRDAADALWMHGHPAEALRLARAALDLSITAADKAGVTVDDATKSLDGELPELDREAAPTHGELYRKLIDASIALDVAITPSVLSETERRSIKVSRIAVSAAILIGCLVAVGWWARRPGGLKATASASWSTRFSGASAADGIEGTEWLLPDGQAGYLDVELTPPRPVRIVKLLNSTNQKDPERSTNDYELQFFPVNQDQPVKTLPGSFGPFTMTPPWTTVDVGLTQKISRVRLTVKTWSGRGGGLAEIVVP